MKTKSKVKLPSTAVGRRRLLKLAGLLEADAKNKKGISFDLSLWGVADSENPKSCGTRACAMGLAVVSGAFKAAGLRNFEGSDSNHLTPAIGSVWGIEAAAILFSIHKDEAEFLFYDDNYVDDPTKGAAGERAVAKRIRQFVAGKAKPEIAW